MLSPRWRGERESERVEQGTALADEGKGLVRLNK